MVITRVDFPSLMKPGLKKIKKNKKKEVDKIVIKYVNSGGSIFKIKNT